ncbi:probable RNA-binding protein CG14230 [Coccinella septempunctata]|uniref:probable RNA-binding protein CG14230 n=1 Tax=Coccinella septempunctata TaxID=41139 RepID=UPI001D086C4A|nr:probable RNA-binding protein CG14230 [Coccinella septempunctata]
MKQYRIFIENLPETVTEPEIGSKFSPFGEVKSIEIKERKVITAKHTSCFFAYVNLSTDDNELQKCFQTFQEVPWCGQFVKLQIAKESFLERLKRERALNESKNESSNIANHTPTVESTALIPPKSKEISTTLTKKKDTPYSSVDINKKSLHESHKKKIESSSSDSSDDEEKISEKRNTTCTDDNKEDTKSELLQIKKAKNIGAKFVNGLLKIEDFKKGHIVPNKSVDNKKILDEGQAEAEARRKKAVKDKIRAYHQQKKAFTTFKTKPKIIKFTDDDEVEETVENNNGKKKGSGKVKLFDSSDSETEEIDVQKNIENRMKSEQRFALDHRFEEAEPNEIEKNQDGLNEDGQRNLKILEEVLGQKVKRNLRQDENGPGYIRYDPSNLDHSKYEVSEERDELKRKKKRTNEKAVEIKEAPEVSNERVFSKNVDFKSVLGKSDGFSLTEIFGGDKIKENEPACEETLVPLKNDTKGNPFKYDSSDEEDEIEQVEPQPKRPKKAWTEPFFLQDNDFRFQEGLDFVKRLASQKREEGQLEEEREKMKKIVRSKMRNVNKKNKRFQRKLGGSKKKKMKRIDKALKR